MDLHHLDDEHRPTYTTGQAADILGVEQPFLRSLDNAGVLSPERSRGGHRRYSRHQLGQAGRLRELFDEGHNLAAAHRILDLERELARARREISELRGQLLRSHEDRGSGEQEHPGEPEHHRRRTVTDEHGQLWLVDTERHRRFGE
ncbi:MerR family transcriptional regulator [Prauserella flavalba]|uniref:MerR family transcriptional regulator n=1 Tax=Prauserella flavalba TaxID=1477506 RepID=UPI000D7557FC